MPLQGTASRAALVQRRGFPDETVYRACALAIRCHRRSSAHHPQTDPRRAASVARGPCGVFGECRRGSGAASAAPGQACAPSTPRPCRRGAGPCGCALANGCVDEAAARRRPMLLVGTSVLVDVLQDDPQWADGSIGQLRAQDSSWSSSWSSTPRCRCRFQRSKGWTAPCPRWLWNCARSDGRPCSSRSRPVRGTEDMGAASCRCCPTSTSARTRRWKAGSC